MGKWTDNRGARFALFAFLAANLSACATSAGTAREPEAQLPPPASAGAPAPAPMPVPATVLPDVRAAGSGNVLGALLLARQALTNAVDTATFTLQDVRAARPQGNYTVCDVEYFLVSTDLYTARSDVDKAADLVEEAAIAKQEQLTPPMRVAIDRAAVSVDKAARGLKSWGAFCQGKVAYSEAAKGQINAVNKAEVELREVGGTN